MAKTIIQSIGPLYGEVVNGTVFGRPNGSVYVPDTNSITLTILESYRYLRKFGNNFRFTNTDGSQADTSKIVAVSQDIAAYMYLEIATDEAMENVVSSAGQALTRTFTAGQFNVIFNYIGTKSAITIEDGTTYYARASLMSSTGVPVAVSSVIPVVGVVPE